MHLNDNVNNKDEVWSKIKHGLTLFKQQLPSGVLALVANDDFGNTSALLIAIEGKDRSYRELEDYSDQLSDRLVRISNIVQQRCNVHLRPLTRKIIRKEQYGGGIVKETRIRIAELGNDAGIIGAAFLGL